MGIIVIISPVVLFFTCPCVVQLVDGYGTNVSDIKCPDYELANGSIYVEYLGKNQMNNTYTATIRLTCNEGYEAYSGYVKLYRISTTATCQENGTWTPIISCKFLTCRLFRYTVGFQPAVWHHTHGIAGEDSYGAIVTKTCNEGYYMNGASDIQCGRDGNWHPHTWGRCDAKRCKEPPQPEFSKLLTKEGVFDRFQIIKGTLTYNATVTVECNPGYILNGSNLVVCLDHWNGTLGNCSDVDECRNGVNACSNNGYCTNTQGSFNCRCYKGFIGNICETAIVCPVPELDQHRGIYTYYRGIGGIYSYNSCLSITCPEGYHVKGANSINCTEAGLWSGTLGKCEVTRCEMPDVQPDMSFIFYWPGVEGNGTYNSTISLRCEVGYSLSGNGMVRCSSFGQWDGSLGNCSAIDCGWPTNIPHNSSLVIVPGIADGTSYNATIQLLCGEQNKYSSTKLGVLQCTGDGIWKGNLGRCKDEKHINKEADVGNERPVIIPIAVLTPLCLVLVVSVIVICYRLHRYAHIVKQHRRNCSVNITLAQTLDHNTPVPRMAEETSECHGVDDHVAERQRKESRNDTGSYDELTVDTNIQIEYEELTFARGST